MSKEQTAAFIPSPEDVARLKESWVKDPCWDIEESVGFEMYREELEAFAAAKKAEWAAARQKGLEARAKIAGLPMHIHEKVEQMEQMANHREAKAADMLVHYFGDLTHLNNDCREEIRQIAANIVEAAVYATRAALLREAHTEK